MSQTTIQSSEAVDGLGKMDVLEQLLQPEVQQSLTELIEQLPKLTELVGLLTKTYDFAHQVATDRVLIEDFAGGLQEMLKPVEQKVKGVASAAIEANERAEQSNEQIGLFGMLRMLKDPEVQRMLRFAQAYLDIVGERKKQG